MFPIKRTVFFSTVAVHKNTVHLIGNIEYQKYPEGIENIRRVSEMTEGYLKCIKGIEKLKKQNTGFQ